MNKSIKIKDLSGIEYHGRSGITMSCLKAISRLIQFGEIFKNAYLISCIDKKSGCGTHGYLFITEIGEYIAIKTGFSSGYPGEGPTGLSKSIQLLIRHNIEIEEYEVDESFIDRIENSCLLSSDIELLESGRPVRPLRYYDYIKVPDDRYPYDNRQIQSVFPEVVPFSVLDHRLIDLAIELPNSPDLSLMSGYRKLEDIIRRRTNLDGLSGAKLFSQAFQGQEAKLHWPNIVDAEAKGRVSLFTGIYMAYRNSRAHRESNTSLRDAVKEFLLINELFVLEGMSVEKVNA